MEPTVLNGATKRADSRDGPTRGKGRLAAHIRLRASERRVILILADLAMINAALAVTIALRADVVTFPVPLSPPLFVPSRNVPDS